MILRTIPVLLAWVLLQGCTGPSVRVWEQSYQGTPEGVHEPAAVVTVRQIPWSRLDETLQVIESERAASDVHRDEWSPDELLEEQVALLRGLQVSEPPEDIVVLGRSVFRTVDPVRPDDGGLERFARSLGADYALWSNDFVGTRRVTRQRPVQHSGFSTGVYVGSGRRGVGGGPWFGTTYVPVAVDADEYAWVVYYLKREDN